MIRRILFLGSISVMLFFWMGTSETVNAQVVYGGRTYVQVPNGSNFYRGHARPYVAYYYGGYPYSNYTYYSPYVQRPYYPPYGTHYYPHRSYYAAPYGVRYSNQWNYRRW